MFRNSKKLQNTAQRFTGNRRNSDVDSVILRLRMSKPRAVAPSDTFRDALRARLVSEYGHISIDRPSLRRPLAFVSVAMCAILVAALSSTVWRPTTLSAAEIVQRVTTTQQEDAAGSAITYERFRVTMADGLIGEAIVEQWVAPDQNDFRYQVTDTNHHLLYYLQRDGDHVWRSIHTKPVGTEFVTEVYRGTIENSVDTSLEDVDMWAGFQILDPVWLRKLDCTDIACFLKRGQGSATLLGQEALPDGRTVYVVQLHVQPAMHELDRTQLTLTIKVDTQTYRLVEVVENRDGQQRGRLFDFEQQPLTEAAVGSNFFSSPSAGLQIAQGTFMIPDTDAMVDRVWIQSTSIAPGTQLPDYAEMEVEVGYELISAPKATLSIAVTSGDRSVSTELAQVIVNGPKGMIRVPVRFPAGKNGTMVDMESGDVTLVGSLSLSNGLQSSRGLTYEVFENYYYLLPPVPTTRWKMP